MRCNFHCHRSHSGICLAYIDPALLWATTKANQKCQIIYIYDRSRCALAFPVPFRRMVWLSSTHWRTDHAISVYALQERAPQGGSTCSTLGLAAAGSTVLAVAPRLHALRSLSVQIVCRLFGLWRRCLHFSCERGRQKKQVQQTRQEAWPRQ